MGRVLLSMTLTYSERPTRGVFPLNSFREPTLQDYTLRVDIYELQEAQNCGDEVWVQVHIGKDFERSEHATKKSDAGKKGVDTFVWKNKKIMIKDLKVTFPVDLNQVPDIILAVYTKKTLFGDTRVSYIRISANDPKLANEQSPHWYNLKSVENNVENTDFGYLLANVVFQSASTTKATRIPKRRDITVQYVLMVYVYGGYDLGPELHSDDIESELSIRIPPESDIKFPKKQGKYPIWNEREICVVTLDENLEFASKILVNVNNMKGGGALSLKDTNLGSFAISPQTCIEIKDIFDYDLTDEKFHPKFHTLMKKGCVMGRILASIVLMRVRTKGKESSRQLAEIKEELNRKYEIFARFDAKVTISLLGLRNLAKPLKNPKIRVILNQKNDRKEKVINIASKKNNASLGDQEFSETLNPNISSIVTFPLVKLKENPLFLPTVEIIIEDTSSFGKKYFMSMPLFEYATSWNKATKLQDLHQRYYAGPNQEIKTKKHEVKAIDKPQETPKKTAERATMPMSGMTLNAANLGQLTRQERHTVALSFKI